MTGASPDLRAALNAITNDRVLLKDHLPRIAELAARFGHTIVAQTETHTAGFNCFAFAFGLWNQADYVRIAAAEHRIGENRFFASSAFARHLLTTGVLGPVSRRDLRAGDVTLYGDQNQPAHAARLIDAHRVRSKWGRGHLYDHNIWEVPARYGHTVRFFRPTPATSFRESFQRFVATHPAWPTFAATYLAGG